MIIDTAVSPEELLPKIRSFWGLSAQKIDLIRHEYDFSAGAPVYTVDGRYTSRSWTEWTLGFAYGSSLLQYDATGDEGFLHPAVESIDEKMKDYLTHTGVHDHGFNVVSTYGNLLRLLTEERGGIDPAARPYYETALRCSGATQASRWTALPDGGGYIYSFNGPHSLFADTIRSLRSLAVAHKLGHTLLGENDAHISLFHRIVHHAYATSKYNVYFGEERDGYDIWGRTAHESIFNINDGNYRCPSSQQGFSPFTTWTRGLAWIITGTAEQLEYAENVPSSDYPEGIKPDDYRAMLERTARAVCDFYIDYTTVDGIPFWDTGAPELHKLGDYRQTASDPHNSYEPVDSSAAAIAVQGLMRLGLYLQRWGDVTSGSRYFQAGLTALRTLMDEPYLSTDSRHQGILLHAVYHRPNGWDHIPEGRSVPCGESCMWGDYHIREAVLYTQRLAENGKELRFDTVKGDES